MATRRSRWIALAVAAVVVAGVLLGLVGRDDSTGVTVVRVVRVPMDSWISTNGRIEPITPYVLRARLDTFVTSVGVVNGQAVRKGQLLVQLDASGAEAQLAAARDSLLTAQRQLRDAHSGGPPDQVAQVQSNLTKAQAQFDRLTAQNKTLENLVAQHAATKDDLAQNELQWKQAQADLLYWQRRKQDLARQAQFEASQAQLQIEQAKAQIQNLSEQVANTRLLAPVKGFVYALDVKVGDYVHVGDPVISVADLNRVRVRAYVDEVSMGQVGLHLPVEITWDGLPGKMWTGRTEQMPKQVVPYQDRRVGEVLCSVNNSEGQLLPNTIVDLEIRTAHVADALQLPREAVQQSAAGQQRYVFLVEGGRLRRQPVRVGIASTSNFQIVSGVKEGDLVAMPGAVALKNGMQVHPVEER